MKDTQVYNEHFGNLVTAMKWNEQCNELYVGDNTGKISVVINASFIVSNMYFLLFWRFVTDSKFLLYCFNSLMPILYFWNMSFFLQKLKAFIVLKYYRTNINFVFMFHTIFFNVFKWKCFLFCKFNVFKWHYDVWNFSKQPLSIYTLFFDTFYIDYLASHMAHTTLYLPLKFFTYNFIFFIVLVIKSSSFHFFSLY